jgi:hypothetical protein
MFTAMCQRSLDGSLTPVKFAFAESSARGSGPVESYSGGILVEDASGSRFYVHEYRGRRTFLRGRRYMLDTGEPVRRVDSSTFVIETTGERLVRVANE